MKNEKLRQEKLLGRRRPPHYAITCLALTMFCSLWLCVPARSKAPDWGDFRSRIQAARAALTAHYKNINDRSKMAATLEERLDAELGTFSAGDKPAWLSESVYLTYALAVADLNSALIAQLASGRTHALSAVRGADDLPFKSTADGTQQPLAVFVPASYKAANAAPLVVFLHGRTQTEADEAASPWIRSAAEATGAIVAAPYARGDADYAGPGASEIYQTVTLMQGAFNIDPKRIYLAGHSMGGFGIFSVGPLHPEVWSGFMCVSGSLTQEDKQTALQRFVGKPVFIVQGSADSVVPVLYARRTAHLLDGAGIPVRYYEQAGGRHSLGTLAQSFSQAWRDMLAGLKTKTTIPPEDEQ